MHTVYLLRCSDNSIYTGCTSNLDKRIEYHLKGYVNSTKSKLPVKLETYIVFQCKYQAFEFEKYLKSGSGRAFMYKRFVKKETA